jgi:tripartite-type tricarboxylate transporter receptor subunit TctC
MMAAIPQAGAQSAADHFKGKMVKIYAAAGAGGVYGLSGRIMIRHLAKHLPGVAAARIEFMPGAGGIKAANRIYNIAPKDGTVLGMLLRDTAANQLVNPKKIKFDVSKFNWLSSWGDALNVLTVMKTAPATTLEGAKKTEVVLGGFSPRSSNYTFPLVLNALVGTKFKVVAGYRGSGAIRHAIDQGEISGWAGFYVGWITKRPQFVHGNKLAHLVQFTNRRYKEFPELQSVPLATKIAKNEEDRKVFAFLSVSGPVARALTAPPGVPKHIVKALDKAWDATIADPAFLKEMKDRHLVAIPAKAAAIRKIVSQILATPPSVVRRYKKLAGLSKK